MHGLSYCRECHAIRMRDYRARVALGCVRNYQRKGLQMINDLPEGQTQFNEETDLFFNAFQYRNASTADADDAWKKLQKCVEAENAALKEQVAMLRDAIKAIKDYEETPCPHHEWDKYYFELFKALATTEPKGKLG